MINIIIIAAEHHYIQVEQAILHFKLNKENTLFWFIDTDKGLWIDCIIKEKNIQKYIISKSWVFSELKKKDIKISNYIENLENINKQNKTIRLIYSQYFSDFSLLAINYLKPSEIILMDEGTASFSVCAKRKKKYDLDKIKLLIKSFYYKRVIKFPNKIIFFTQYNFAAKAKDVILRYSFAKEDNKLNLIHDEVAILGSSMAEVGLVKQEYYLELIKTIKHDYSNNKILYFSHRKESFEKLEKIKELGFEIVNNEIPFEFYFKKMKECPAIIVSFFSPTLLNLEAKYKMIPKFFIYEFDLNNILYNKNVVEEIYNSYRENKNLELKKI